MEDKAQLEILKLKVELLERETSELKKDVHKILGQLTAMRYLLLGVILAEGPQALTAIKSLIGFQ